MKGIGMNRLKKYVKENSGYWAVSSFVMALCSIAMMAGSILAFYLPDTDKVLAKQGIWGYGIAFLVALVASAVFLVFSDEHDPLLTGKSKNE